ncbi:hypothetical protein GCM10023169_10640 [Georgenia halophila]|uniref:Type II secretion system protein GspF domain-containing protein n=1 Tax=Georgenia halophila TaxID=620889 RepID=A0ABP8KZC1_9MICO
MTLLALAALAALAALPWSIGRPGAPGAPRKPRPPPPGDVDIAVLLDLADAALDAGASVPGTLTALGRAIAPADAVPPVTDGAGPGSAMVRAARALLLGSSWSEAWEQAPGTLRPLVDALEPAWVDGAAPGPLLRQAAGGVRATRAREAQEAAAKLSVRLVLPLGLCYLPAFVLVGVVPVILGAGWLVMGG